MPCFFGTAEAYVSHLDTTSLEFSPDSRVDTLRSPPRLLYEARMDCEFAGSVYYVGALYISLVAGNATQAMQHSDLTFTVIFRSL